MFWRKYVMVISPENCEEIAQSRRIKVMEFIRVGNFESILSHHSAIRSCLARIARREDLAVKTLKFSGYKFGVKISLPVDLSSLHLLSQKVANLDLSMVNLTPAQLDVLLKALSVSTVESQKRRSLNIRKSSLAELSLQPDQFADIVVNKLDELNMSGTNPSEEQMRAVLMEILASGEGRRLRSLTMGYNINIGLVEPDLLASAVCQLTEVNLSGSALSVQQIEAVLGEINAARLERLEVLSLGNTDMSEVDSSPLGRALCRVRKVQIWSTKLNRHQLREICQIIYKTKDRRLQQLDLEGNDVHQVFPETLGLAVCSLKSVDLHNCKVTLDQVNFIFNQLAELPPARRNLRSITLTDKESVNYKENQSLALNLDILRGQRMFQITKRFLQFHGVNDTKHWRFEDIRRIF